MNSKLQEKTVIIDFTDGKAKTLLKIGYIRIYLTNHFNWLHKKLWKLLLNIEIENVNKQVEELESSNDGVR